MMLRTGKRFLWILLGLTLAMILCCCAANAESGTWGNLNWELDDNGVLTIRGSGDMDSFEYDSADAWRASKESITSVIIEEGVTSICPSGFSSCISLTSVSLPNTITSIGSTAFNACSNLKNINIPASIITIETGAFQRCTNLTNIIIPNSITDFGNSMFYGCSSLTNVSIPDSLTKINEATFYACSSLTSITIPSNVTSIGDYAFQGCSSLTSLTFPANVISIGNNAFCMCDNLTSVTIPSKVISIGNQAFYYCSNLESIVIPASVTAISNGTFDGCNKLTISCYENSYAHQYALDNNIPYIFLDDNNTWGSLTWELDDNGVLTISGSGDIDDLYEGSDEAWSPYRETVRSVVIENGITSVGEETFSGCNQLINVTIPNSVKTIGIGAFRNCSSLTNIDLPDSIESIGANAFSSSGLTSIQIPVNLTSMDYGLFLNCSNLTNVILPAGITRIEQRTFAECNQLQNVIYSGTKAQARNIDFSYGNGNLYKAVWTCSDGKLTFPLSGTSQGFSWVYDPDQKELDISGSGEMPAKMDSPWLKIHDLVQILRIEPGITRIGESAFDESWQLRTIEIPDTVTSIGAWAFWGCDRLTNVTIPDSVTSIEDYAFSTCGNMANSFNVFIPATVTAISNSAFDECETLTIFGHRQTAAHQYAKDQNIPFDLLDPAYILTLPASTTTIESEAFAGLTSVDIIVIPASVTSIADDAFASSDVIIKAPSNSFAYQWATSHGFDAEAL